MRQVANMRAGAAQHLCRVIEQPVKFFRKGADFLGKRACKPFGTTFPNISK